MLYTTNLLALVGAGEQPSFSPRRLTVWNTNNSTALCEISFLSKILCVKMNKQRLIVCVKDKIHIYDITTMKLLHSLQVNYSLGRFSLSASIDNSYLVYSDTLDEGIVSVYDVYHLFPKESINAHKSPILKLAINFTGNMLATASCKGTIVRIFSLPKGEKLYTFKRGMQNAHIFSMNFSVNCTYLITSSNSGTLHLFQLDKSKSLDCSTGSAEEGKQYHPHSQTEATPEKKSTWGIGSFFKSAAQMILPKEYEDAIGTDRSAISINSKQLKIHNICALSHADNQAFAFTKEGRFYLYEVDAETSQMKLLNVYSMYDQKLVE